MKCQFRVVQTGQGARELVPRDSPKDGVMTAAGIEHIDLALAGFDGPLSIDEVTVKRWGIALFKTAQMPGQHSIEGIGHHRQQDIEMDFDQDWGR